MVPQWASTVVNRVVAASSTPLGAYGMFGVASSLTGFGLFTAAAIAILSPSDYIVRPKVDDAFPPTCSHTLFFLEEY
jgi:hypothetical protein